MKKTILNNCFWKVYNNGVSQYLSEGERLSYFTTATSRSAGESFPAEEIQAHVGEEMSRLYHQ